MQSNLSMKHLDPATAMAYMLNPANMMGMGRPPPQHHSNHHLHQPQPSSGSNKFVAEQRSSSMGSSGSKMSSSSSDSSCQATTTSSGVPPQQPSGTHVQSSTKIWQPPVAGIYDKQRSQEKPGKPESGGSQIASQVPISKATPSSGKPAQNSSEVYNITSLKYTPNTSPQSSKKSPDAKPPQEESPQSSPSNQLGPLLPDGARARYLTPSESNKLYSFNNNVPGNNKVSPSNEQDEAPTDLTVKKKRVVDEKAREEKVNPPKQEEKNNCRVEEGVLSHFSQQQPMQVEIK